MKSKGGNPDPGGTSGRIPLVFGVSGHRDPVPGDLPTLYRQLQHIFARFHAAYPATPFKLLSPLAEGADRLIAEVALSVGVELLVPLPMKQREYERDFTAAKSLTKFRALLARAESHWELPVAASPRAESRTMRYAGVGDFIARYSHVLILLWDGGDNRKIGGTAWVKKRREHWVNAASDPDRDIVSLGHGPTIQVVTPRASGRLPRPRLEIIGDLPPSAAEFAKTLSKPLRNKRGGNSRKRPAPYQFVYWAINNYNSRVPNPHSATRSRL